MTGPRPTHLGRRGAVYFVRFRIPTHLKECLGLSERIDNSNRSYGLCRGLVAALVLTIAWCLYAHRDEPGLLAALAVMIVAAVWRMRRAGVHYARALFLEFIDLG